jgi:phosphoribosyl 1,2-cyclic phosphate phosphodiesterase
LRSSALLTAEGISVLIDAGPDLRQQMLRAKVQHLDGILLTHEHNDHVIGLDDVRPFNYRTGQPIAVYAQHRVVQEILRRFDYIFGEPIPGLPRILLNTIDAQTVLPFGDLPIQPVEVLHGSLPILGFRMGDLTYLTDVKTVSAAEKKKIAKTKYLVVNALHHNSHPTHMNLEESLSFIAEMAPEKAWLTHISHQMGLSAALSPLLPPNVALGYDGLEIEF